MLDFYNCVEIEPNFSSCVVNALACTSLGLTGINIIAILVFGWLVLWLKEVTPEKVPQALAYFWKRDVKNHRKLGEANVEFNQAFKKQAREVLGLEGSENNSLHEKFRQTIVRKITQDPDYKRISDLQFSTFNLNALSPADSCTVDMTIPSRTNVTTNSPISKNLCRFMTSNLDKNGNSNALSECVSPTIDSKLYHQAELLIKNSSKNLSLRQLHDGTIERDKNENNKVPQTAPITYNNTPPRFN